MVTYKPPLMFGTGAVPMLLFGAEEPF
uniref:Uncharacterized protein n=1 Tax=Rhizophora mucronata TaxID=61149 RepID=A0A2P2NJZ1_RHIMU